MHSRPPSTQTLTVTAPASRWLDVAPARSERRVVLVVLCRGESEVVELRGDRPVVCGRRPPCEVVIDDVAVSRLHARFSLEGDRVQVEDLDSRNGTFSDGARIVSKILAPGERVQIGPATVVAFVSAGPSVEAAASGLVVVNDAMRKLWALVDRLAERDVPVLVVGESGTGKEHVARALHDRGPRRKGPFVPVNCGAIPETLAESTLFGHEKGAFTGATGRAAGVFERAHGGTLFLDEIGEMPEAVQAKVLRVIETSRVTRVGASQETDVDVRLVAATHQPVDPEAPGAVMRPDLYYRLSTVVLTVPPLRDRRDEIEPLARQFLDEARAEWQTGPAGLEAAALEALRAHDWPGNVRELRHVIQRAALLCDAETIGVEDLGVRPATSAGTSVEAGNGAGGSLDARMLEHERAIITEALERSEGNRTAAAQLLGMPRRTFYRKLRQHGLIVR